MNDEAGRTRFSTAGHESGPLEAGSGLLELSGTADGSMTLFSCRYDQTFHSHHGAVAESRHVFLEGSGVAERVRRGEGIRLLEVGFGTGLNFLVTAQLALEHGATLEYVALEQELLPAAILESLDYLRFAPDALPALLDFRRSLPVRPPSRSHVAEVGGSKLELRLGDARQALAERRSFGAVYHDAFSPDANPELWEPGFLARLADSLVDGGVLVSYTVKGEVRRRLAAAGLDVSKAPGPAGGKREMLRAIRRRDE